MAKKPAAHATKPKPWSEMATHLVDVAMGRKPADLVIRNGRWVNVHSGEIIAGTDIAIAGGPLRLLSGRMPATPSARAPRSSTPAAAISCPASATRTCMSRAAW